MSRLALIVCLGALAGCRAGPPGAPPAGPSPLPERGLTAAAYEGAFREHPLVRRAAESLGAEARAAAAAVRDRLGLALDPDLPRRVELVDRGGSAEAGSRLEGGRRVQVIGIPAAPIAQGRRTPAAALADALARAAVAETGPPPVPDWFAKGAPLWLSGEWERALYERLLGGERIPDRARDAVPEPRLTGSGSDEVASAFFLRFVATEFGADRIAVLGRAFAAGAGAAEALRAALGTDPASLPTAFEGYRARVVGGILEDPFVRELASARSESPERRVVRLAGLVDRAPDPWVAASILEARGAAEFESGDYEGAAATFARIERDFAPRALALDRDRFLLNLTFLRRGDAVAAGLRLESFLSEFPESPYRARAGFELAGILLDSGRSEDAMARYAEVAADGGETGPQARIVLAAWELARFRYALADRWLAGLSGTEAERLRAQLAADTRDGLPEGARGLVRDAVRGLSGNPEAARAGAAVLMEVGPAAAPAVADRLAGDPAGWPVVEFRRRVVDVARGFGGAAGKAILLRLLADPDPEVGSRAVRALIEAGAAPGEVRAAAPAGSPAAREIGTRYGGVSDPETAALLGSAEFRDRVEAAARLGRMPGAGALGALCALAADPSPPVRAAVAAALGGRAEAEAGTTLAALARDEAATVRAEANRAAAVRGEFALVRETGAVDADARVRLQAAGLLVSSGTEANVARAVAMLTDPDPGVRSGVEGIVRGAPADSVGPALAAALLSAGPGGDDVRLARILSHLAGRDFGYDPEKGAAERARVADAFLALLRERRGG